MSGAGGRQVSGEDSPMWYVVGFFVALAVVLSFVGVGYAYGHIDGKRDMCTDIGYVWAQGIGCVDELPTLVTG